MDIINVKSQDVEETRFFCKMSHKKNQGYVRKLNWINAHFDKGLKIKMLDLKNQGERDFIENIPGKFAWCTVREEDFIVIHCL